VIIASRATFRVHLMNRLILIESQDLINAVFKLVKETEAKQTISRGSL
jgi:hypothetical protein